MGQSDLVARDIPILLIPSPDIFAFRAARLRQLTEGHPLGDCVRFIVRLAESQDILLKSLSGVSLPDAKLLAECKHYRIPPLTPAKWRRNMVWLMVLEDLVEMTILDASESVCTEMMELMNEDYKYLESLADKLLSGQFPEVDWTYAPFIGAALQVYWTHLARSLTTGQVPHPVHPNLCPVCGSKPIAFIERLDGKAQGICYLQCSLCGCEWQAAGTKCNNSENANWISFSSVWQGVSEESVEICHGCQSYLMTGKVNKVSCSEGYAKNFTVPAVELKMMGRETVNSITWCMRS